MASIEVANLFAVKSLVAVITGGGSGIGLMMAKALATNGASKVYIVGRRKEVLEEAAKSSIYRNIIPVVGDVTSKESLQSIAYQVEKDAGYVNVLIANRHRWTTDVFFSHSSDLIERLPISTLESRSRRIYKDIRCQRGGCALHLLHAGNEKGNVEQKSQVIVTSSIAGFNRNVPGGYAYGQSKAAATQLVKQMATQMVHYDIRSNAIAPGLYPSEMSAPIIGTEAPPKHKIPAERIGSEEDMAGCILFLTSRAGAYLNGNVIVTDGGRLSIMPSTY